MEYIYEENRIFVAKEDGNHLIETTFPYVNETSVEIDHVFVDPSLRGQGRASEVMSLTYDYLKDKGYKIIATCPYAKSWFKKHPDKQDILVK